MWQRLHPHPRRKPLEGMCARGEAMTLTCPEQTLINDPAQASQKGALWREGTGRAGAGGLAVSSFMLGAELPPRVQSPVTGAGVPAFVSPDEGVARTGHAFLFLA